jgi:adenylate cyclase
MTARLTPEESAPGNQPTQHDLYQPLEDLLLGGPRQYTRAQLAAEAGVENELIITLWRSLGFAEVGDDEVVFTEEDRAALHRLVQLRRDGLLPTELEGAVARSVGLAMAGLANWQVEMVYQLVDYGHGSINQRRIMEISAQLLPQLRGIQTHVWRRHLAAAAGKLLATIPGESDTRTLVVGFVDMVGFTRATRQLSPSELVELIECFQQLVSEVVATWHGRVVKTVGDEVLFVTQEPSDGAEIALTLLERLAESATLPELRIGLAVGPVLARFGDVYGEPVNIAARLTANARPGKILADRNLAALLEHDGRFHVRVRRPLAVRGYRHLQSWKLTRAKRRSTP